MKKILLLYNLLLIFCVLRQTSCELICKKIDSYEACKDGQTGELKSIKKVNNGNHSDAFLYLDEIASIDSGAFGNSKTLHHLTIDGSNYELGLESNSFSGLENLKSLKIHMTFVKLDKIILRPLTSLEYLSLSIQGNSKELEDKLIYLKSLKDFEIFHSFLNTINENTFNSVKSDIKRLSLIDCNISTIEPMSFWTLNHLEALVLNENELTILKSDIFYGLKKLKYLFISSNNIKTIEPNLLNGLSNLIELDLSNNVIDKIDINLFNGTAIEKLFLQNNLISVIETGIFNTIKKTLREIHLQDNHIYWIKNNSFIGLNLTLINLRYNELRIIPTGTFKTITIDNLYLENNYIHTIENNAFENSKIQYIFLSNILQYTIDKKSL